MIYKLIYSVKCWKIIRINTEANTFIRQGEDSELGSNVAVEAIRRKSINQLLTAKGLECPSLWADFSINCLEISFISLKKIENCSCNVARTHQSNCKFFFFFYVRQIQAERLSQNNLEIMEKVRHVCLLPAICNFCYQPEQRPNSIKYEEILQPNLTFP